MRYSKHIYSLQTTDQVIDALGGTGAVARRFGYNDNVVSNWRARGFPPSTFSSFQRILAEMGQRAPATLWRQREVVE